MANLVTRQRRRQLAAVGAVDLARIKTVVVQFVLHRSHIFIGRSRSGERKSGRDRQKNKTHDHIIISKAAHRPLLRKMNHERRNGEENSEIEGTEKRASFDQGMGFARYKT